MADARPPAGVSWAHAAAALAARVNRRDRRSVVLWRVGLALLTAAGAALLWRALGPATWGPLSTTATVSLLLLLGLLGGLLLAWRASHRATPVAPPDAAWALDRVARAEGRGLAAAAATGPAASEAAFAGAPLGAPPVIRLLPPRGLVPLAAGVLLGVL
ncbi:MAG: hypothetical protein P1V36_05765, partial [Planctomycetota bacterium]|nr:hypothetical protein [Planctomycetota bacterium]